MKKLVLALLCAGALFGQIVQESFARDPGPLDFIRGDGYEQIILQSLAGDALVGQDAAGRAVPRLAEAWTVQGREIRFKLRADARFADGSPVRPEDVLWTFAELQRRTDAAPTKRPVVEGLSLRRQGREVIVGASRSPQRLLLELARIPIARQGCPGMGSGPFLVEKRGGEWLATARPHFLHPRIQGIRFRALADDQAILLNLQKGWLSLGVPPPRRNLQPPASHRELRQPTHAQMLVWSRSGPGPLRWLERWRAEAFHDGLFAGKAAPSRGLWPESLGFHPMAIQGGPLPPAGGQHWEILYSAGDELQQKALLALRERAKRDGVDLEPRPVEAALLVQRIQRRDFQLACLLNIFDPHPWSVLELLEPEGPLNFLGWSHPRLPALLARLDSPASPAWDELQRLWAEAPVALPLLDFTSVVWIDRRLRVEPSALGLYVTTPGAAGWSWTP